jgi:hypothetical protein
MNNPKNKYPSVTHLFYDNDGSLLRLGRLAPPRTLKILLPQSNACRRDFHLLVISHIRHGLFEPHHPRARKDNFFIGSRSTNVRQLFLHRRIQVQFGRF